MNISQLEYLVSAIHLGSYSRAAKEQFVTPQAVSKAIRTLESELGLKLIASSGKTISPTDVGLLIAEEAEAVIDHVGRIFSIASAHRRAAFDEARLRCAVSSWGEGDSLLSASLKALVAGSDQVESLIELPNERCISGLKLGYVDYVVLLDAPMLEGFERKFLFSISPHLLLGKKNPLAVQESIAIQDLGKVKLALPFHAEEICPHLQDMASGYGVDLDFEMVNDELEPMTDYFAKESNAALLVIGDSAWKGLIPDVVSLPFAPHDGVHFPVSAVFPSNQKENADKLCDLIGASLKGRALRQVPQ